MPIPCKIFYFCTMDLLSLTPLMSVVLGIFLSFFILFRKAGLGANKHLRYVLTALVLLYSFIALDNYLVIFNNGKTWSFGLSDYFIHFTGFLFYYFVVLYTKTSINIKRWGFIILIYTLIRWTISAPIFYQESITEFIAFMKTSKYAYVIYSDYIVSDIINIIFSILAFFKFKNATTVVKLNPSEKLQFRWIRILLSGFIFLQIGILINSFAGLFNLDDFETTLKFDTLLIVIFFFMFTYSIMRFPVFVFTGDFEDLPKLTKKKYAKSSLNHSLELYEEITTLVVKDKLYRDFDLRLNTIAEKLGKSIHHISQAINQNAKMSFPEYINRFRIEEAKRKLLETKSPPINSILLDVGFNSKAAFYKAFKKVTSQTPSEFKKMNK